MKLLIFHIGADRYGLRLRDVVRVLPLLELKHLPLAPDAVAGLMDFHGKSVPVIDLCRISGLPSGVDHFDTRIIVVDYHAPEGTDHLLGLRAERVLGVQEVAEAQLADSGVTAAPFLGQVASDAGGMLQLVELEQLLPASLRAMLFQT
ncbi:chemotaxis protein CheW [Janthinobacterium sp. HH01]|uniref:chemotaxis protein CheW n=1 Tax=Janthinobacterium sp. HH01 TaxID=1198452 RepID=UPI0002AEAFDD|nr:chemotaxis protein CheW [Janthinobacterium sp. HH01]ELX13397.1 chemotaxis protein CheW [Janthinobacterium sp. HH01]